MTEERLDLRSVWRAFRNWLQSPDSTRLLLVLILFAAAYLRLTHLDWDEGTHIHPDERFLTMVSDALKLPQNLGEFFDTTRSPLSPYNKGYNFFVYGTLPIFIVEVVSELAHDFNKTARLWTVGEDGPPLDLVGYGGVHLVGRALSGLFDLGCVLLVFIIGRRLYGRKVGLLGATLYAFAVLPLQQSHFYTVDTFANFFALLTFYFAVRVAQGGEMGQRNGGWGSYVALGASLGASLASRINLAPLAGIVLLAAGIRLWDDWHVLSRRSLEENGREDLSWLSTLIQATLFRLLLMGLVTFAVFRVGQPYAFGGTGLLDLSLNPRWQDNMRQIRQLIGGDADYPPGHQWTSRTPFVFPFVNMVVWGMGLPLGLTAWAGWALAAFQVLRGLTRVAQTTDPPRFRMHLLPVAWIGGMFLWHGLQYVQSMRYYLPIYPLLAIMAAWLLWRLAEKAGSWKLDASSQRPAPSFQLLASSLPYATYVFLAAVTIFTMLWGWGFLAIYRRPLSRITASRWIYANVPPGSVIGNEHWDDGLPLRVDGKDGFGSFGYRGLSSSSDGNMQMYWEDTPEKREQLYKWLNEADYLVLSSNRLWGSIPRLPMRYPMTTLYYRLLFSGKLGFEQVAHFTSFPTIFGIEFNDTGAEEAFSVYDHPEVYIFKKTPAYSEGLARSYFDAIDLEHVIQMWPKQVSAAPTALLMSEQTAARQRAGGTWSHIFNTESWLNRWPGVAVLAWLLLLTLLGVLAFPLASVVLRTLPDLGYGVSKTLGLLLLAWLAWIGPSLTPIPYQRWTIVLSLLLLAGVAVLIGWRRWPQLVGFVRQRWPLLVTQEGIFLALFALFLLIRIGNPDLWHPARGGEKPMDFAYLNAVIKSTTFPPYDPWHAGGFLNYYYFGFVIVGTVIKLTGIVPWVAYNLAVPTLFALTGLGAFAVAYALADGDRERGRQEDEATEWPADEVTAEADAQPADQATAGSSWLAEEEMDAAAPTSVAADVVSAAIESPVRPLSPALAQPLSASGLLAGLAATFFVALIGNFGTVKLLFEQWSARSTLEIRSSVPGFAKLMRGLDGALGWLTGKQPLDFPNDWWFWNPSRVIPETINEFPFFTFTYADLHAHMIALPLTLLGLAIAVALVRLAASSCQLPASKAQLAEPSPWHISLPELLPVLLLGFILGALQATNTWDFPTYVLAGVTALAILEGTRRLSQPFPVLIGDRLAFLWRALVAVLWRTAIMLVVAVLTFYPYSRHYATAYAGLQLWEGATTKIPDYLTMWGFFLVLAVIYLLSEWAVQAREQQTPTWLVSLLPLVIALVILLLGIGWALKATIWLIAMPLFVLAGILALGRDIPPARRFGLLMLALALAITMGVEVVRQKDDIGRMNTVFKFYMQAWTLFGIGTAFGLASWSERAQRWAPGLRRLAWAVTGVLFVAVMLYPLTAARAKIADRFSAEASPRGLDGMAYMDKAQYFDNNRDMQLAYDKDAILWMLNNVEGSPVILEGTTPGYRWGSRYSIYTGLPAVQGWDWHQKQQRSVVPHSVIDKRLADVREMYDTTDLVRARRLLDHYGVSYIIVGPLEQAYYSPAGLAKFDQLVAQGYLEQAFANAAVKIYRIVGREVAVVPAVPSGVGPRPVPTPTVEGVLPAAKPFVSPQQ